MVLQLKNVELLVLCYHAAQTPQILIKHCMIHHKIYFEPLNNQIYSLFHDYLLYFWQNPDTGQFIFLNSQFSNSYSKEGMLLVLTWKSNRGFF